MPFYKAIPIRKDTTIYLWKIEETLDALFQSVTLKPSSMQRLENMKSESHQKGFLAVRKLLLHLGYSDADLVYDASGKPTLRSSETSAQFHVSISHSHAFSALALSRVNFGMDLELLKEKTLKIAPRFMDVTHLDGLHSEDKIKKATVIWGIKEAIFKLKNEVGISFPNHIIEMPFDLQDKKAVAQLDFNKATEKFDIHFDSVEDYIFVCAFDKKA